MKQYYISGTVNYDDEDKTIETHGPASAASVQDYIAFVMTHEDEATSFIWVVTRAA